MKGLELNCKKTEVMVLSRKLEVKCNITINGAKIKQCETFRYLGILLSEGGRNNKEISARIAQAKSNFQKMKAMLTNNSTSMATR